ncbi:Sensor histidine kinase LiaS [Pseudoclavibacter triregionum]|nr:Sensor histidine kinase LiaS [Pseudoclavibacter triregionum]
MATFRELLTAPGFGPRSSSPGERRVWEFILAVPPLLFIAVPLAFAAVDPARTWIAIAALVAFPLGYWTFGRRLWTSRAASIAYLVLITLATFAAMVAVPPLAMLKTVYFPLMWKIVGTVRAAIGWSLLFGLGVTVVTMLGQPLSSLPSVLVMAAISVGMSIGIGLAITYAWHSADERAKLLEELRATQGRLLEASRLAGVSTERERISRELHDTIAQSLVGAGMLVERAKRSAGRVERAVADGADPSEVSTLLARHGELLDQLGELSSEALAETRAVIAESAPVADGPNGFLAALERLANRYRRETGLDVTVSSEMDEARIDRATQVVLLRCAQEGLANVRRHASAHAASIAVREVDGCAVLTLADDGVGLDPATAAPGFGLPSLRERAASLGGSVEIASEPDGGTEVVVRVPLAEGAGPSAAPAAAMVSPVRDAGPESTATHEEAGR